jgi:hypothetical protein
MNKTGDKNKKLPRIIPVFLLCALFICAGAGAIKLRALSVSLAGVRNSIAVLQPLDDDAVNALAEKLAALREKSNAEFALQNGEDQDTGTGLWERPPRDIHETAALIRGSLRENGILSERLRFSGKTGDESAEFILRCKLINYLRFLDTFSRREQQPGILSYLSIGAIPGSAQADITMRFFPASRRILPPVLLPFREATRPPLSPETVAKSFAPERAATGSGRAAPVKTQMPPQERAEAVEETETLFLGFIREADGTRYAYHKEIITGKIVKILQEEENE